jgi:LysR family hydrogen peroxide-inducible transcriptional activator
MSNLQRLNFSLTQIEYALSLHRHGHFAKAAEECLVTQPTLSMQIQKLETLLNIVLFDRSKKPILLTDAGKKLLPQFQKILNEAKKIDELLNMQDSVTKGELELAIIPTISTHFLPLILPTIQANYPGLQLKIREMQTAKILEALENDQIDVGLLATPLPGKNFFTMPLYLEPFYVLAHEDHPLSKLKTVSYEQLRYPDIWLLEVGHCLRSQVLNTCNLKPKKDQNFSFESGNLQTLINLVSQCGGYTLIPHFQTHHIPKNCQLISFKHDIPVREVSLVFRREHYKYHLIELIAQMTKNHLPKKLLELQHWKNLEIMTFN